MSAKNIFSMSCGGFDFIQSEKKNVTLLSFLKTQRALRKINAHGIFFRNIAFSASSCIRESIFFLPKQQP